MEEELQDFLDEVDYVTKEVETLMKSPSDEEPRAKEKRIALEEKRNKQAEERKRREEELLVQGKSGHGDKFGTYQHYCPRCIREFSLLTPTCPNCHQATLTVEERRADLTSKVAALKEERTQAVVKRNKWENWKKTEALLYRKTGTNYRKWDYFEPEEEEELPFVPPEDPAFKEMEQDMERRKIQRKADFKRAEELKEQGNSLFRQGNFAQALEKYEEAQKTKRDWMVLYTNSALARLKLKDYSKAVEDCNRVLEYCEVFEDGYKKSPEVCFKALTRRAMAHRALSNPSAAVDDLTQALSLQADAEAASLLARCKEEARLQPTAAEAGGEVEEVTDAQSLLTAISVDSELLRFVSRGGYQALAHQVYLRGNTEALEVLVALCADPKDYLRLYPLTKRVKGDISGVVRLLRAALKPDFSTLSVNKILQIISTASENAEVREELMEQSANSRKWAITRLAMEVFLGLKREQEDNVRLAVTIVSNLCLTVKTTAVTRRPNPGDMKDTLLENWEEVRSKLLEVRAVSAATSALFALYCNLAVHAELRGKLAAEAGLLTAVISELKAATKTDVLESGLGLLINAISGSKIAVESALAEEALSIAVRCLSFARSTEVIEQRAMTLVARLAAAKGDLIPAIAANESIKNKITSSLSDLTLFQQGVKVLILCCPQPGFAASLPHSSIAARIQELLSSYLAASVPVELAANSTLLVCRLIDADEGIAEKYSNLIPILISAVGEKADVVRKNSALALGRLAKNPTNLATIRELHGLDVLRSVSGFVID